MPTKQQQHWLSQANKLLTDINTLSALWENLPDKDNDDLSNEFYPCGMSFDEFAYAMNNWVLSVQMKWGVFG